MDLMSEVASYVFSVVLHTAAITAGFIAAAIALYYLLRKFGLTQVSRTQDAGWFKFFKGSGTVIAALVIGISAGSQIAVANISLKVVADYGPAVVNTALESIATPLGLDPKQDIDISAATGLVDGLKTVTLVKGSGISAKILNTAFEMVRDPFIDGWRGYINILAPGDRVNPAAIVSSVWSGVYAGVEASHSGFVSSTLSAWVINLLIYMAVAIALTQLIRLMAPKPKEVPAPAANSKN